MTREPIDKEIFDAMLAADYPDGIPDGTFLIIEDINNCFQVARRNNLRSRSGQNEGIYGPADVWYVGIKSSPRELYSVVKYANRIWLWNPASSYEQENVIWSREYEQRRKEDINAARTSARNEDL